MKANTKYNKIIAKRFHNFDYYECNRYNTKNQEFIDEELEKLLVDSVEGKKIFRTLKSIYEKNKEHAFGCDSIEDIVYNSDLLNLISSVPLLVVSYSRLRKSSSLALALYKKQEQYEYLDQDNKDFVNKSCEKFYKINMKVFQRTSKLLKLGQYPWGTHKIVSTQKPGSKRSLIVPFFMDTVVQEAIREVLVTIYEPIFDKMNVSFCFRQNRSIHDSIHSLTNELTQGLNKTLGGEINLVYDELIIKKLISILRKRIKDRKFLNLIEDSLNYNYNELEKNIYVKYQSRTKHWRFNSPYLWEIYMLEFDIYIVRYINNLIKKNNEKNKVLDLGRKETENKQRIRYSSFRLTIQKILSWIRLQKRINGTFKEDLVKLYNTEIIDLKEINPLFKNINFHYVKVLLTECNILNEGEITIIRKLQLMLRETTHIINNLPLNINKQKLKFIYTRYADNWIILTNMKMEILKNVKKKISEFLKKDLCVTLLDKNTLLTDISSVPAYFLGFELKTYKARGVKKYTSKISDKERIISRKILNSRVFAGVDKKKLIYILHLRGYCDKNGFPREIPKLGNLEAFTIIGKTNNVLMDLAKYYINVVRNPKLELSRWVYIIRFSCMKTLALKYKTTLKGIFTKFGPEILDPKSKKTIQDTVTIEINNEKFSKTWTLSTIQTLIEKFRLKDTQLIKKEIKSPLRKITGGKGIIYEETEDNILIESNIFLSEISSMSIKRHINFDLPCCICSREENIEMHYIKFSRKTKYIQLDQESMSKQRMCIINKTQIPICQLCRINVLHKDNYVEESSGSSLLNKTDYGPVIEMEQHYFNNKIGINISYNKTLIQNGWKKDKDQ